MRANAWRRFDGIGFGADDRASFACDPSRSHGRLLKEPESPTRTCYQRDRDRVIHSTAFRRLKAKTQVFINHQGDHFRTRLTHTLEVSQLARSIARALRLNEDLAEALALAHDLGHTPFGHAGEDALDECMSEHGGFDHNAHTLRIVTALERRYATFDGLNLAWETLEGIVKHNGPLFDASGELTAIYKKKGIPIVIQDYQKHQDLRLSTYASLEAQAAAIADDVAYNAHDVDDGLRDGCFTIDELSSVPMLGDILEEIEFHYPGLEPMRQGHELVRRMITRMVEDVIWTSERTIRDLDVQTIEDVRNAGQTIIAFSPDIKIAVQGIKSFLFERMYRSDEIMVIRENAQTILRELYEKYLDFPYEMSSQWRDDLAGGDDNLLARRVGDYVAGMTDRFAVDEHKRLFDQTPELR